LIVLPFSPEQAAITYNDSVSSSSNPFALNGAMSHNNSMELKNRGPNEVFFKFGTTAATTIAAAGAGYMLSAGERVLISRPTDTTNGWFFADAICATGQTAKVVITLGIGN